VTIVRYDAADCLEDVVESLKEHTLGFNSLEELKFAFSDGEYEKRFKITIAVEEVPE